MTSAPNITLNNGVEMPQLGLGVWRASDDEARRSCVVAIDNGYRSIDTASLYKNEEGVGRAVAESRVSRGDLFITTKLWNNDQGFDAALKAFDASLDRLGMDYVDLYLIHWPAPGQDLYVETWKALERVYADKRARAIGVSNFHVSHLERLAAECEVVPALNQIELHPYLPQAELRGYHAAHGIHTEAWRPIGQGGELLVEPGLMRVAAKHGKSVAQVVLRWHIQLGNVVIPKSVTPSRIVENIDVFDFTLDEADLAAVAALESGRRMGMDPDEFGA